MKSKELFKYLNPECKKILPIKRIVDDFPEWVSTEPTAEGVLILCGLYNEDITYVMARGLNNEEITKLNRLSNSDELDDVLKFVGGYSGKVNEECNLEIKCNFMHVLESIRSYTELLLKY